MGSMLQFEFTSLSLAIWSFTLQFRWYFYIECLIGIFCSNFAVSGQFLFSPQGYAWAVFTLIVFRTHHSGAFLCFQIPLGLTHGRHADLLHCFSSAVLSSYVIHSFFAKLAKGYIRVFLPHLAKADENRHCKCRWIQLCDLSHDLISHYIRFCGASSLTIPNAAINSCLFPPKHLPRTT